MYAKRKVFNVGLPKTGTSSFCKSMQVLGYKTKHWDFFMSEQLMGGLFDDLFLTVEQYDAFSDFPWASIYQELDRRFLGSRFILTQRQPEKWLQSTLNHFDPNKHPETVPGGRFRQHFFGFPNPKNHESAYLNTYNSHCASVKSYFQGRQDFLVVDFEDDLGWKPLTDFLGLEEPDFPFPHVNKGDDIGRKSLHL